MPRDHKGLRRPKDKAMKLKIVTGVIQGIKNLEKQVNDFCEDVDLCSVSTSIGGAQVIITITYTDRAPVFNVSSEAAPKKKVSKAKSK